LGGRAVALALVVFSLGAAACGSDGGQLSAREFTRRAAATCARADRRVSAVALPPLGRKGTARAMTRVIDIERDALGELHELQPPKALAAAVDEWLATVDQLVVEAEFLRESLRHGDRNLAQSIAIRAARLSLRSQVLATQIRVTGCTVPTPPPIDPANE